MYWPYGVTTLENSFRSKRSGGFEGMAMTSNGNTLLPILEKPLEEGEANTLLIHEFDLAGKKYTGARFKYRLHARGTAIGDFIMFNETEGLIIERDGTQGDLNGFKTIYKIELRGANKRAKKTKLVNLQQASLRT